MDDTNFLSDGRGLLCQANLGRRMAIRTVLWNPSYFAAPFHRPRRRGFLVLAKTALCCMGGRRNLRSSRPQFGWASKPRTANGNLSRISEPLLLLVSVSLLLALWGFLFEKKDGRVLYWSIAPGAVVPPAPRKNGVVLYRHVRSSCWSRTTQIAFQTAAV